MAFIPPKDRVAETSTSNSQSVFALAGALDTSYNAFSAHMSVGDTTLGAVVEPGVAFKAGLLTYSASNEVTVTTATGSKGTFSAGGTKEVMMGLPALPARLLPATRTITGATSITIADWGKTIFFNSATAITVTIDAVATLTDGFWCKFKNINSGVVTLDPNSSETIDGLTTIIIPKFDAGEIHCTGSVLHTINRPTIILLDGGVVTNAASLVVALPSGFEKVSIVLSSVAPQTDGADFRARISLDGSTYESTSAYRYGGAYGSGSSASGGTDFSSAGTTAHLSLSAALESDSTGGAASQIDVHAPEASTHYHRALWKTNYVAQSGVTFILDAGGHYQSSAAWLAMQLYMSTGNINCRYLVQGHRRLA